jgi:nitrite reductase/ring-hydroxylating ferredoxin subunit
VLMATGFAKWGMTGGTAAALLLCDLILGRDNASAGLFDPNRVELRAAAPRFVEENARVALRFAGDRITKRGTRPIESLEPGEGDIVRLEAERVAGHRRDDGTLVAVSPNCSHLGCQVSWNRAERSWDCPCHGSRFSPEGEVLQGPAVHRLERKPIE